jgi:hypothetical protein
MPMPFDREIIEDLRSLGLLLEQDNDRYLQGQESLAGKLTGRESALEDIIYDFDESSVRLEAMMVSKLMPGMDRLRIFLDLSIAEKDPELKKWAGVLFRQEHLLKTASKHLKDSVP